MTNRTSKHFGDEAEHFRRADGEISASSPARRLEVGETVILIFRRAAAASSPAGANSPGEIPSTLGELALRLVANFKRPSCKMLPSATEGETSARQPPEIS